MTDAPSLSVVIPVHNKRETIDRVLDALLGQSITGSAYELIVVDDHSTDGSAEHLAARAPRDGFRLLHSQASEPSAAATRNCGIAACRGERVLLLDADVVAPPALLEALVARPCADDEVLLLPTIGASCTTQTWPLIGARIPASWSGSGSEGRFAEDVRVGLADLPAPWVFCWTTGVALATALARRVGGFEESLAFKGSEDIDFGLRLHEAGAQFRLAELDPLLHLPHPRDRVREERTDRIHEHNILRRFPRRDVEMLCAFDAGNCNAAMAALADAIPWRGESSPWAGLAPFARPQGRMLLFFGHDPVLREWAKADVALTPGGGEGLDLFGLALPFADAEFDTAVIPDLRGWFPEPLICRLFEEGARVARRLLYLRVDDEAARAPLLTADTLARFDRPYWERSIRVSRSYHDWQGQELSNAAPCCIVEVMARSAEAASGPAEAEPPPDFYDPEFYELEIGPGPRVADLYVPLAEAGGPVLELGCGTGDVLLPIARRGIHAWGIDCSERMLERARLKAAAEPPEVRERLHFERANMEDFSLPRRFAQIFLPNDAIGHLLTTDALFAVFGRCANHLEPGGRLVLDVSAFDMPYLAHASDPLNGYFRFRGCAARASAGTDMLVWERTGYDPETGVLTAHFRYELVGPAGTIEKSFDRTLRLRPRPVDEIVLALGGAGFRDVVARAVSRGPGDRAHLIEASAGGARDA